ncbi:hypothetical protein V8C37DRAFT_414313 [Trichoderma ceciliae]
MPSPDSEEIKKALMAELGRSRQDELPLSNQAKRSTYQPDRSRTSHIPQARKERLESKWGVKIVDEESQQMEGLELGNSRPWAKLTNQFMARHVAESAPPRLAMGTTQLRTLAIPKAPSSIKPSRNIINTPAQTLPAVSNEKATDHHGTQVRSGAMAVNNPKTSLPPSTKGQGGNASRQTKHSSQGEPELDPSTSRPTQEHILSQGGCEMINESENSPSAAEFILKVQLQKNEGLLIIVQSGIGQWVHDVLILGPPVIQGPFCLIANAKGERLYKMKFQTTAAAEGFQYLLKSLQQSALQFRKSSLVSPKANPTLTGNEKQATIYPLQTPSKAVLKAAEAVSEVVEGEEENPMQTPDSMEAPLRQESESLVDIKDDSPPKPTLSIDGAADHMQSIVQQILSEITATGINVPENGVEEIESTAISNWMAQGFMKSETGSDELKEELAELLRLLVRIKRKVHFRHGGNPARISSATLQDLQEIVEKPSKRIKYTTTDIKQLEAHAVSRQNEIKASGLREIQKGSPSPESLKTKAVPSGLATSRWATSDGWSASTAQPVATTKSPVTPPKAPTAMPKSQKPNPKGLGSSRWADKPVENEGKFAGVN